MSTHELTASTRLGGSVLIFVYSRPILLVLGVLLIMIMTRECMIRSRARREALRQLQGVIEVDDVTRLNRTEVSRVFMVRSEKDVVDVLQLAVEHGKQVSLRGTRHTMGGHTIARGGYVIDLLFFNHMEYDKNTQRVRVQPGTTWEQLIRYLNQFGRSPTTMQSYCSFSVGGTVAVNAHGITNDFAMYESVASLRVVLADGTVKQVTRNDELFRAVIGGYGLFGVITELELTTAPNSKLSMEMVKLPVADFETSYLPLTQDPQVAVKIARIDLTTGKDIFLFVFRSALPSLSGVNAGPPASPTAASVPPPLPEPNSTISDLTDAAREMQRVSRFLYKWVMPWQLSKRIRFLVEDALQKPLDWQAEKTDRNSLMYESATPLAQLYNLFITVDHTFILQEYFVPKASFQLWMKRVRTIVTKKHNLITLLNITVRFVFKDEVTLLPYATDDCFAFVLYFRLPRTKAAERELQAVHEALVSITLKIKGTFYLPYRHHYTKDDMVQAYPNIKEFFNLKATHDPANLFSNLWYERYAPEFIGNRALRCPVPKQLPRHQASSLQETEGKTEGYCPIVPSRRTDSFHTLMRSEQGRARLLQFLRTVFSVAPSRLVYAIIAGATWNPANKDDWAVYQEMVSTLKRRASLLSSVQKAIRTVKNLNAQSRIISDQAVEALKGLGITGGVRDMCFIGDHGRYVKRARQGIGAVKGKTYIVHDTPATAASIVERGSLFAQGEYVPIDYDHFQDIDRIPSQSVDIVVIMMGLHHFDQEQLPDVIRWVYRVLRPGGVFIVREHDALPNLVPMCDVAHAVFNAVTGVCFSDEQKEIRAFRPVEEWRRIITSFGFHDGYQFGKQVDDPTEDILMCFLKDGDRDRPRSTLTNALHLSASQREALCRNVTAAVRAKGINAIRSNSAVSYYKASEWLLVELAQILGRFMEHTTWYHFPYFQFIRLYWGTVGAAFGTIQKSRGFRQAFFNYGFLMDLVIGLVTTLLLLQLGILSVPLYLKDKLTASSDPDAEDVVVTLTGTASADNFLAALAMLQKRCNVLHYDTMNKCCTIRVPRYKPFTNILQWLAITFPDATVLEISGCRDDLQVRCQISNPNAFQRLQCFPGVRLTHSYDLLSGKLNSTTGLPATQSMYLLSVPMERLFAFLQECRSCAGVQVTDVYDFY